VKQLEGIYYLLQQIADAVAMSCSAGGVVVIFAFGLQGDKGTRRRSQRSSNSESRLAAARMTLRGSFYRYV
jgi:hypothetical protein